jgi:hypothetical protein
MEVQQTTVVHKLMLTPFFNPIPMALIHFLPVGAAFNVATFVVQTAMSPHPTQVMAAF